MKNFFATVLILLLIILGAYWIWGRNNGGTLSSKIMYQCDAEKTLTASFYDVATSTSSTATSTANKGRVELSLSDGRTKVLNQTASEVGGRYSDGDPQKEGDETIVFFSQGDLALVLENNNNQTYTGCIKVVDDPGTLPNVYASGARGISIRYADNYTVTENYTYQGLGPGKNIGGVKFTIASSSVSGTNLGSDTYISVEGIPQTEDCKANLFLPASALRFGTTTQIEDGNVTYSFASTTGAAAGNRYEEKIYAISGTNPCIAVRYFIHYGAIENYGTSTTAFDRQDLLDTFDDMRESLTIAQ